MIHLRAAGTSLVLDARGTAVPAFVHWGADLGDLSTAELERLADAQIPAASGAAVDSPIRSLILPLLATAWQGRPALVGRTPLQPFALSAVARDEPGAVRLTLTSAPLPSPGSAVSRPALEVVVEFRLTPEGLLRTRSTLLNRSAPPFELDELNVVLPLPARATELLDFTGHWLTERMPQRSTLRHGAWLRESRHGRPGHDASFLTVAGTPGYGFRSGDVWAAHLGFSGSQRVWVERQVSALSIIGAGELLAPGEVVLAPEESYSTPWLSAAWSNEGLDAASQRFHRFLRRERGFQDRAHPVILNTWEAVYFDHDELTLRRLADAGARVGAERFVLDDGWMTGRTDDRRALGDWTVDSERWPQGLGPLIDYVTGLGLDFGLWVEPEMANPDSRFAREHPDWILTETPGATPLLARNQLVVDLANPDAFTAVFEALDALLGEYDIRYLKWDHNRDVPVTRTHAQTRAAARLMDALLARHPALEIESCASGGARADLAVLERTTRVWASDTNDPLERQSIYRYTSLLLPPEVLGVHLGAPRSHTTGRTHSAAFRFATTLFGWAGIEWNLLEASEAELEEITRWLDAYREVRPIIHGGTVVRADRPDPTLWVHGVVTDDQSDAVFAVVAMASPLDAVPAPVLVPGLDANTTYRVSVLDVGAEPRYLAPILPPWLGEGSLTLSGRLLAEVGLAAPPLAPEEALVLRITAV
ncbi:alpha-galactosidase [Subtercola boreus]|uniref:alpha-galactosidase n=1 Tax=Subtercola boreus TaxID=120213 RepID=UPI001C0EFB54|nr:alpha-galactosidase [Subtercola boreus]